VNGLRTPAGKSEAEMDIGPWTKAVLVQGAGEKGQDMDEHETDPVAISKLVKSRVQAIGAETGFSAEHVLFMIGMQNDDLSVRIDPAFIQKYLAFMFTATSGGRKYRQLEEAVALLLAEITEFGLRPSLGQWAMIKRKESGHP
jgi:hypothetical protein